jgi:hypothetical protein
MTRLAVTQSGRKLDHSIAAVDIEASEHTLCQLDAAGPQNPFAETGQQPVSRHLCGGDRNRLRV